MIGLLPMTAQRRAELRMWIDCRLHRESADTGMVEIPVEDFLTLLADSEERDEWEELWNALHPPQKENDDQI